MKIKYLSNNQIDKARWDKIVDASPNGRIYGYSWYLDGLADDWGALVADDYEYIFPLPFCKKYGIYYIVNPFFVQQLGIYSEKQVTADIYAEFMQAIPCRFRHIDLCLSIDEAIPNSRVKAVKRRTNFILDINKPYEEIAANYSTNVKRILRKTSVAHLEEASEHIKEIVYSYRDEISDIGIDSAYYDRLLKVAQIAAEKKMIIPLRLLDADGQLLSSYIFFTSHNRAYYVAGGQTSYGKKYYGAYMMMDKFFQNYCRQFRLFDFEGSDLSGVAEFFRKWGSVPEYYTRVSLSRFPINLIKR